jgi:hypothetical protein
VHNSGSFGFPEFRRRRSCATLLSNPRLSSLYHKNLRAGCGCAFCAATFRYADCRVYPKRKNHAGFPSGETVSQFACLWVVDTLELKEGDHIEVTIAGARQFEIRRDRSREAAIARLRKLGRPLPPGFTFDRTAKKPEQVRLLGPTTSSAVGFSAISEEAKDHNDLERTRLLTLR